VNRLAMSHHVNHRVPILVPVGRII
jgi:hypothetical protein